MIKLTTHYETAIRKRPWLVIQPYPKDGSGSLSEEEWFEAAGQLSHGASDSPNSCPSSLCWKVVKQQESILTLRSSRYGARGGSK